MELSSDQRNKLDLKLFRKLERTERPELVSVVFILAVEDADPCMQPKISQFLNYVEWRKAYDAWRKRDLGVQLGPTLRAMKDAGLDIKGEGLSRIVAVSGLGEQIVKTLDLEKVQYVILDHPGSCGAVD